MTRLRKATLKDFKFFRSLYVDMKCHCLYSPVELQADVKPENELTETEKHHIFEMGILAEEFQGLYKEYAVDDFKRDLESNEIFIFERDTAEGYFMIAMFEPLTWRIVEWGANPLTKANRLAMLELLLKNARAAKIRKIELVSYCSKEFYKSNGFIEKNNGFFQKEM